jgi:hypothetical protein
MFMFHPRFEDRKARAETDYLLTLGCHILNGKIRRAGV